MKYIVFASLLALSMAQHTQKEEPFGAGFRMMRRIYNHCEKSEEVIKCLKEQAVKIAERAIKLQNIPIMEGVSVVKRKDVEDSRSLSDNQHLSDDRLRTMSSDQLDEVLADKTVKFFETHQMSLSMSSLLGNSDDQSISRMIEEGRGKMKKYMGPLLTALAIKGGFVAMAFQAIAMIAGKALLIGKIALVLSAIIGLRKLVSGTEAHEKTTYEIVKHPQVSQSHTYSSSHFGDYETSGSGGHYRRSLGDDDVQSIVYNAYTPRS